MRILIRKNYTFKIYKNRKVVSRLSTHLLRRFLSRLRTIKFSKRMKVYLRVSCGRSQDSFGKVSTDFNDGFFKNQNDLIDAFNEALSKSKGGEL